MNLQVIFNLLFCLYLAIIAKYCPLLGQKFKNFLWYISLVYFSYLVFCSILWQLEPYLNLPY